MGGLPDACSCSLHPLARPLTRPLPLPRPTDPPPRRPDPPLVWLFSLLLLAPPRCTLTDPRPLPLPRDLGSSPRGAWVSLTAATTIAPSSSTAASRVTSLRFHGISILLKYAVYFTHTFTLLGFFGVCASSGGSSAAWRFRSCLVDGGTTVLLRPRFVAPFICPRTSGTEGTSVCRRTSLACNWSSIGTATCSPSSEGPSWHPVVSSGSSVNSVGYVSHALPSNQETVVTGVEMVLEARSGMHELISSMASPSSLIFSKRRGGALLPLAATRVGDSERIRCEGVLPPRGVKDLRVNVRFVGVEGVLGGTDEGRRVSGCMEDPRRDNGAM